MTDTELFEIFMRAAPSQEAGIICRMIWNAGPEFRRVAFGTGLREVWKAAQAAAREAQAAEKEQK